MKKCSAGNNESSLLKLNWIKWFKTISIIEMNGFVPLKKQFSFSDYFRKTNIFNQINYLDKLHLCFVWSDNEKYIFVSVQFEYENLSDGENKKNFLFVSKFYFFSISMV